MLNVVKLVCLLFDKNGHVHEDLLQIEHAGFQFPHLVIALLYLTQHLLHGLAPQTPLNSLLIDLVGLACEDELVHLFIIKLLARNDLHIASRRQMLGLPYQNARMICLQSGEFCS